MTFSDHAGQYTCITDNTRLSTPTYCQLQSHVTQKLGQKSKIRPRQTRYCPLIYESVVICQPPSRWLPLALVLSVSSLHLQFQHKNQYLHRIIQQFYTVTICLKCCYSQWRDLTVIDSLAQGFRSCTMSRLQAISCAEC